MYQLEPKPKKSGCISKIVKGFLAIFGLIAALVVIALIFAPKTPGTTRSLPTRTPTTNSAAVSLATEAPAATVAPTEAPTVIPAPVIGQDVMVDEVRWKVLSAEDMGNLITDDNQFTEDLKTSGKFIKVRFEIENRSKDMLSFVGLDLIDNQERSFTRSSNAIMVIEGSETCILENLNPNITKTCTHIYEVPTDAAGLNAVASDLNMFSGTEVLIALGM